MDDLEYTKEDLFTRAIMLEDSNSLTIYVEDQNKEYEYETIFKRMLDENDLKDKLQIIALGDKGQVKYKFQELKNLGKLGHEIFIVDGDFDRYIKKEEMIEHHNFIYLETYNIENYFIDENAIKIFFKGIEKKMDKEINSILKFSYWRETIVSQSTELFLTYCFVQKNKLGKNVKDAENNLDDKTGFLDIGKVKDYLVKISQENANMAVEVNEIKEKYMENNEDFFNLICGKFLLQSLFKYMRKKSSKISSKFKDLRWHLISNFDVSKLDYIKNIIIENSYNLK